MDRLFGLRASRWVATSYELNSAFSLEITQL